MSLALARATNMLGGIDVFVNNAGIETNTAFTETPRSDAYHALNNAPRRMVQLSMAGVKLPLSWHNETDLINPTTADIASETSALTNDNIKGEG